MKAELQATISQIMAKGERSPKAAKRLRKARDFDFAASRAYYAMFYYATAVLLTKGLSYSRHSGVVSGFGQHFVKPRIFPKELSKKLSNALDRRHLSDYEYGYVTKEAADQTIKDADDFVKLVRRHLKKLMKEAES